ncbi:MAG: glycosyl transferase family 1 [Caldilinea sp. CFX5]|nr:glycosyl transferase family 1 [Caldilinea sp. CFX5]
MSTAIVLNLPEAGHMNTTFPLVAALAQRGERVIYYAVEPFRQAIESARAEFRSYANPQTLIPSAHNGGLYSVMAYLAGAAQAVLPQLIAEVRAAAPDYLLLDSMCLWGALVQQHLKIPAITLGSVFVTHPQMPAEQMIRMSYQGLPKEVLLSGIDALHSYFEITQRLDQQYATRSPNIVGAFGNAQPLNVLFTAREFHPNGNLFAEENYKFVGPSVGLRAQTVDFPFDQLTGAPLVYISLGTIFNERPDFYNACFAAFADTPFQVVMAVGDKIDQAALTPPPANFIVRSAVPQLEILQRAALFITHGGMNSSSEGLLYGVPLIVAPQHGDQFLVASRVVEVGAGLMLPAAQAVPAALKGMAMQVLSTPTFKERAQAMSRSFQAGGGPQRAADEIVAYTRKLVG